MIKDVAVRQPIVNAQVLHSLRAACNHGPEYFKNCVEAMKGLAETVGASAADFEHLDVCANPLAFTLKQVNAAIAALDKKNYIFGFVGKTDMGKGFRGELGKASTQLEVEEEMRGLLASLLEKLPEAVDIESFDEKWWAISDAPCKAVPKEWEQVTANLRKVSGKVSTKFMDDHAEDFASVRNALAKAAEAFQNGAVTCVRDEVELIAGTFVDVFDFAKSTEVSLEETVRRTVEEFACVKKRAETLIAEIPTTAHLKLHRLHEKPDSEETTQVLAKFTEQMEEWCLIVASFVNAAEEKFTNNSRGPTLRGDSDRLLLPVGTFSEDDPLVGWLTSPRRFSFVTPEANVKSVMTSLREHARVHLIGQFESDFQQWTSVEQFKSWFLEGEVENDIPIDSDFAQSPTFAELTVISKSMCTRVIGLWAAEAQSGSDPAAEGVVIELADGVQSEPMSVKWSLDATESEKMPLLSVCYVVQLLPSLHKLKSMTFQASEWQQHFQELQGAWDIIHAVTEQVKESLAPSAWAETAVVGKVKPVMDYMEQKAKQVLTNAVESLQEDFNKTVDDMIKLVDDHELEKVKDEVNKEVITAERAKTLFNLCTTKGCWNLCSSMRACKKIGDRNDAAFAHPMASKAEHSAEYHERVSATRASYDRTLKVYELLTAMVSLWRRRMGNETRASIVQAAMAAVSQDNLPANIVQVAKQAMEGRATHVG